MNGKRTLVDMVLTLGVGAAMLTNISVRTEKAHNFGEKIASNLQGYVGSIGAGAVEYGLPSFAALGTIALGLIAVRATDKYLMNRKRESI